MPTESGGGGSSTAAKAAATAAAAAGAPPPTPGDAPGGVENVINDLLQGKNPFGAGTPMISKLPTAVGATGQARLTSVLAGKPAWIKQNTAQFDRWILALPEDIKDIEYTRLLRQLKAQAQQREAGRKALKADEELFRAEKATVKGDTRKENLYALGNKDKPVIKGLPVTPDAIFGDQEIADPQVSAWLQQFVKSTGLDLGDQESELAAKSGLYVYVGQEPDPQGGPGFTRPVYLYRDDAKAMLAAMDPAKLKEYQKRLGLSEHGLADPILQGYWDDAVAVAEGYARRGIKVDLQYIFDTLINAVVEKNKKAGGGRGGGGAGGIAGMSEEEKAYNYYFAMMQILGDISGVQG